MEKILVSIVVASCLSACVDRKDDHLISDSFSKQTELKITTKTFSFFRFREPFVIGNNIGIYVFSDKSYQHIRATAVSLSTNNQLEWICEPSVQLAEEPVLLYACAPYSFTICSHPSHIPLQIGSNASNTPDYRYGRLAVGHKPVTHQSPWAVLSMKPVLSQLVFCLKTTEKEPVYLSAIQIGNRPGTNLFRQLGALNLLNGHLTTFRDSGGSTRLLMNPSRKLPFCPSDQEEIKVFPTDRPMQAGEVEVFFVLNTKKYTYSFPKGTFWEAGHRYIYELIFAKGHLCLHKSAKETF